MNRRATSRAAAGALFLSASIAACSVPAFELDRGNLGFELPDTPVLVLFVDGIQKRTFERMLGDGELPLIRRYMIDRAVRVENAVSDVPSVTYANAATMVTGQFPGHHGIFANRWFDRDLLTSRNYETAATMSQVNDDLDAPTIFEILSGKVTAAVGMQINRGAHLRFVTTASDGGLPAGIAWTLGEHAHVDAMMAGTLGKVAAESRILGRWPDFTLVYFPAVDAIGHSAGPDSEAYRQTLRSLDGALGGALRTLDGAGLLERMTVVLASEHGHVAVGQKRVVELDRWFEQELGIPTFLTNRDGDLDDAASFAQRFVRFRRIGAVATHDGERHASLHLESTDGWSRRPGIDEILAFGVGDPAARQPGDAPFPERLVRHEGVAFAAVRASDEEARLWGKRGAAVIERRRLEDGVAYRYRVAYGADPLGYSSEPRAAALCDGAYHRSREWLEATATLPHPDIVPLLGEAFESPRAGDVMLFAAPGWSFSTDSLGGHGGLERDEMSIPLFFAGPGLPPGGSVPVGRLADIVPTVLDLMGWRDAKTHPRQFDGVSLAGRLRDSASRPASRAESAP